MIDSSDHVTGKTGLSPTVTISKNGGSFAAPAGAVTELANGWYKVAGNATDTGATGPLLLHATATGADPVDDRFEVVAFDPDTTASGGLPVVGTGANNFKSDASANVTYANAALPRQRRLPRPCGRTPPPRISPRPTASATHSTSMRRRERRAASRCSTPPPHLPVYSVGQGVTLAANQHVIVNSGTVTTVSGNVSGNVNGSTGSVAGDVAGKVLGGGSATIAGVGVRAVDGGGNAIAPAATALTNATWTDARAAKLDYLTGSVALAAAALTNATWTDARATKLDYLTKCGPRRHRLDQRHLDRRPGGLPRRGRLVAAGGRRLHGPGQRLGRRHQVEDRLAEFRRRQRPRHAQRRDRGPRRDPANRAGRRDPPARRVPRREHRPASTRWPLSCWR